MLRGEIRLTDLDPAQRGEADKRRPAVIVINNRANASAVRLGRGVVTVVPVTSNVAGYFRSRRCWPREPGDCGSTPGHRPSRSDR